MLEKWWIADDRMELDEIRMEILFISNKFSTISDFERQVTRDKAHTQDYKLQIRLQTRPETTTVNFNWQNLDAF